MVDGDHFSSGSILYTYGFGYDCCTVIRCVVSDSLWVALTISIRVSNLNYNKVSINCHMTFIYTSVTEFVSYILTINWVTFRRKEHSSAPLPPTTLQQNPKCSHDQVLCRMFTQIIKFLYLLLCLESLTNACLWYWVIPKQYKTINVLDTLSPYMITVMSKFVMLDTCAILYYSPESML